MNGISRTEDTFAEEEQLLEAFSSISQIDSAWCRSLNPGGKGALDVTVSMSQRNLPSNTIRKFISNTHIPDPQGDLSAFHWAPFPMELTGITLYVPSPSGTRLFIARNADPSPDKKSPVKLEIWGAGRLLKEFAVPSSLHGPIYNDKWFESVSWNADETLVAYVAEEPPKARPIYGRNKKKEIDTVISATGEDSSENSDPGAWKGHGEWVEDWGENYVGKGRPIVYVYDTEKNVVLTLNGIPSNLSMGQVVWAPLGPSKINCLVFVAWPDHSKNFGTKKKLGIAHCSNRPCFLLSIAAPSAPFTSNNAFPVCIYNSSALSPRFSPDGSLLVFLSAQAAVDTGTHNATNSLHSLVWPLDGLFTVSMSLKVPIVPPTQLDHPGIASVSLPAQVIIDIVARPEEANGFPGLYCLSMINNPWLSDGRTLLLTTTWRSTQAIIAVHAESFRVSRLTPEGPISWKLHDVNTNVVVAGASTPACPTKLMLGRVNAGWLKAEGWLWSEISPPHIEYPENVENALKSTEFEVIPVPVVTRGGTSLTEGAKQPFEAVFVRRLPLNPKPTDTPAPLVVVPHGGPHSVTPTSFIMPYAFLCALGFNVLHVNYRGSTGFGEEALQSLPRNIGRQDVGDVLAALDKVLSLGYADISRVAIMGGSHGGFLACHLIGQAPDRFRTAVIRNPVCNIASMVGTTDIPDWCYVETLGAPGVTTYSDLPSVNDLQNFHRASPINYVSKVKVPTLFCFGAQDRRVPPSNGLQFVQALRAQGLESKVLMFPEDSHGLEKPQTEFEFWMNAAIWFKRFFST